MLNRVVMPLIQSVENLHDVMDAAGVSRIALTLISGRCGSTWLASEIRELGAHGLGHESLDPIEIEAWENKSGHTLASATGFTQWLRDQACGSIVWVQVGAHALSLLCETLISSDLFWTDRIVVNALTRRDHIAQALSFTRANMTGEWHRVGEPAATAIDWPPEVNDTLVRNVEEWLIAIHEREATIEAFRRKLQARRKQVPSYFYEDLVVQPGVVISKVCNGISGRQLGSIPTSGRLKRISSAKDGQLQLEITRLVDRNFFLCCAHCKDIQ